MVVRVVHCTVSTVVVRSFSVVLVVVEEMYELDEVVLVEGGGGGADIEGEAAACPMAVLIAC